MSEAILFDRHAVDSEIDGAELGEAFELDRETCEYLSTPHERPVFNDHGRAGDARRRRGLKTSSPDRDAGH